MQYLFLVTSLCVIGNTLGQALFFPSDEDDYSAPFLYRQPERVSSYRQPERISEQKCREYSRLVTEEAVFTTLDIDAKPFAVESAKCSPGIHLIVGGEPAKLGEFPFMAALGYESEGQGSYQWACGGTLISENFVLTAAHCISTRNLGRPTVVRLGDLNLYSETDHANPKTIEIVAHIKHPNYTYKTKYDDIGLLKLKYSVEFSENIRPACLWQNDSLPRQATATGWGMTEKGRHSDELRKVNLKIYPNSICNDIYTRNRKNQLRNGITDTMICAGEQHASKDTCEGDSGGPLVATKENNQCVFYTLGVTSFGRGLCGVQDPAIYTKISEYISWIEEHVWPQNKTVHLT